MSETTPRLGLPWLMPAQAQKHVTVNEALGRLDALVSTLVESRGLAAEPASPQEGVAYILPAAASGASWDHFDENDLVYVQDGAWHRIVAREGLTARVGDEAISCVFDGTAWTPVSAQVTALDNLTSLGVGTASDAQNLFAAKLNSALWTARFDAEGGTGDLRYTLNKEAPSNVLSLLLQSGWSGRAEIGLTGTDDLAIKVSPDGSSWIEALTIDRNTGTVSLADAEFAGGRLTGLDALSLNAGGTLGFGSAHNALVRRAELGSAAFADGEAFSSLVVRKLTTAREVSADDRGRVLVQTGGGSVTLPDSSRLEDGWWVRVKNRSGTAIDIEPQRPSEAIDAGAPGAAVSLADGDSVTLVLCGTDEWERI